MKITRILMLALYGAGAFLIGLAIATQVNGLESPRLPVESDLSSIPPARVQTDSPSGEPTATRESGFIFTILLCTLSASPHGCDSEDIAEQIWQVGPLACSGSIRECYWDCMDRGQRFAGWLKTEPYKLKIPSGRFGVKCEWSQEA